MDSDGLPLVGPGIDYTKVEAINQKRTVAFINHFVTHTCRFLNRFSYVCEEKLEHLTGRLQQLEISLGVLEAKLSSIPGLESVTAPQSSSTEAAPAASTTEPAAAAATTTAAVPAPPPPPGAAPPAPAVDAPPPPVEEAKPNNPVSQDPRYSRFFKMLQYGVNPQAVKAKMGLEGLNPDLLDTPDAPAPEGSAPPAQESDSESDDASDFSDD